MTERFPRVVVAGWEHSFPGLGDQWTHWALIGDNHDRFGLVHGNDLSRALKAVAENYGKYASIKAARASVDETGQVTEEKTLYEISRFEYDEQLLDDDVS